MTLFQPPRPSDRHIALSDLNFVEQSLEQRIASATSAFLTAEIDSRTANGCPDPADSILCRTWAEKWRAIANQDAESVYELLRRIRG